MKIVRYILFALLLAMTACSRFEQVKGVHVLLQKSEIRQRYGGEMGALADELKEANVTHVIVPVMEDGTAYYPSDVLPQRWEYGTELLAFRHALRRRNINFVAQIPIFQDSYTYRSQPALRAVNEFGSRSGSETLSAICPTDQSYQEYKLQAIEEVMLILQPDGIYIDKLSFPVEQSDICTDILVAHSRNYCFCPTCLTSFSEHALIELPKTSSVAETNEWVLDNYKNAWIQWKTGTITAFMEKANKRIHSIDPECKIMLSVLPWKEDEYNKGRQRLAGQDVKTLAPFIDNFILKTSCQIPDENFDSIRLSLLEELENTDAKVIPTIQLEVDSPHEAEKDFQHSLQYFRHQVIVSDWGYMLKNRRYLNIFITEPII
ncbi:MAG: hypothetical protein K9N05_02510 [Candidatus Marinimicrobia bacterium]|nr:hypothetical protein [Candidatus Neomarinimicrobiota bacterium]